MSGFQAVTLVCRSLSLGQHVAALMKSVPEHCCKGPFWLQSVPHSTSPTYLVSGRTLSASSETKNINSTMSNLIENRSYNV